MFSWKKFLAKTEPETLGGVAVNDVVATDPLVKPQLLINPKPYAVMYYATQAAEGEVSGLGKVKKVGRNKWELTEAIILGQNASAGYTVLSDKAMSEFLYRLAKQKKDPSEYNFWWHSHVDMPTFWSGVDEENARRLTKNREFISLVMNKKGKVLVRFDSKTRSILKIPYAILPENVNGIKEKTYKEVKTKVKPMVYERSAKNLVPLTPLHEGPLDDFHYGDTKLSTFNYHNPAYLDYTPDPWEYKRCIKCGYTGYHAVGDKKCCGCGLSTLRSLEKVGYKK
jgi:hypothetical protein